MHFDVFNGDADGIIALLQLRLAKPMTSQLVTGVKRDIQLLKQVNIELASSVTVLDISMEKNAAALSDLLARKVPVFYVDHHRAGAVSNNQLLTAHIDTSADTCTSLLVNDYLQGRYVLWAVTAAYGDNMIDAATALAVKNGLSVAEQQQLRALGIYINYNGYGRNVSDLHVAPKELYQQLLAYDSPFDFINSSSPLFSQLEQGYLQDMASADSADVLHDDEVCQVIELIDAPWAHRVSGVFGNELANRQPNKAHAVLTPNTDDSFTVSIRAPLDNKQGADKICVQFPTGGGRAGAAGINQLPKEMLGKFIEIMSDYYKV